MLRQSTHNYSFDALRAISVVAVFLYHLYPQVFPHAYLGVVGFFCLAGYLSIRKLIISAETGGLRPKLLSSLGNRAAKLYPPLILLLICLSVAMLVSFPQFLDNYSGQLRSGILSFNNIWQILQGESYFQGQLYLKPITHLWALSLEIQFYILFTLTVERIYHPAQKKFWFFQFFLLTIYSSLSFIVFFDEANPSRVYYGTDSRLFSFAIGMMAALLFEGPAKQERRERAPRLRNILSLILFILLILAFFLPIHLNEMMYYGIPIYTILFVFALMLTAADDGLLHSIGKGFFSRYICARSYEIYLWHYPVFLLLERYLVSYKINSYLFVLLQIVSALLISELAFQFNKFMQEKLSRKQKAKTLDKRNYQAELNKIKSGDLRRKIYLISSALLATILLLAPWQKLYEWRGGAEFRQLEQDLAEREAHIKAQKESRRSSISVAEASANKQDDKNNNLPSLSGELLEDNTDPKTSRRSDVVPSESEEINSSTRVSKNIVPQESKAYKIKNNKSRSAVNLKPGTEIAEGPGGWKITGSISLPKANEPNWDDWIFQDTWEKINYFNTLGEDFHVDKDKYLKYRDLNFSMIGDSVSVINSYHIFNYWPNLYLDALSNRQMNELYDIYLSLKESSAIGEILVVALGSNGDIDTEALEKVWEDLADTPLVLINIVSPYNLTEAERNAAIEGFVKEHEQVYLVDWHANAKTVAEYFQEDYIHPSDFGCKAYSQLITAKLMEILDLYASSDLLKFN